MENIAEILKNAPQGLKLYSLVHGEVTLEKVFDSNDTHYPIVVLDSDDNCCTFTKYGKIFKNHKDVECVLFPSKEHKTWDDWQSVLFQVGDVVINQKYQNREMLIIIKKYDNTFTLQNSDCTVSNVVINNYRYATPEEREQFFKELNANGYTWNNNTKQMEKSLQTNTPKYKIGDYIVGDDETIYKIMDIHSALYTLYDYRNQNKFKQMIKKIDENYSLVTDKELIDAGIKEKQHKFKAGDVIRNKETGIVCKINYLAKNWHIFYKNKNQSGLKYENEDKWELVTVHKTKSERHYITPHREFFNWIYDRLVNLHGENPNVDYMLSLKERIDDLFPEKEETDTTSEPTEEKPFTIDDFKPFDKVLVQDMRSHWTCDFYIRYDNLHKLYVCISSTWDKCIPYNDETAHLLNTTNDCPEKYKTWED